MKKGFLLLYLMFFITSLCQADYIENLTETAHIDWTNGVIRASGVGYASDFSEGTIAEKKLEARQAAKADAIRKLAEAVNNVRVDGKTTVKNFQAQNDIVRTHVSAFVKNCAEKEVKYLPEGKCEVIVEASLNGKGSLSHIIYDNIKIADVSGEFDKPVDKQEVADIEEDAKLAMSVEEKSDVKETVEVKEEPTENDTEVIKKDESAEEATDAKKTEEIKTEVAELKEETETQEEDKVKILYVSGLIVNAKKTIAKPAINPSIISDTGEKLYNISVPDRKFRTKQGLVSYTAKIENAEVNKRVTKKPYVIDAIKIIQEDPCIIMVSQDEFDKFMKIRGSDIAIERCRVIIVVGK